MGRVFLGEVDGVPVQEGWPYTGVIPVVTQSCQSRLLSTTLLEDSDDSLVQFGGRHTVTVIPGDGVGPELVNCVKQIFKVTGVPVDWEEVHVSDLTYGSRYTLEDVKESLKRTGVGLKGALTTPSALSAQDDLSLNQRMKVELDLFANVVQCRSLPGFKTRQEL
ncbi:Isocitrate dehydrogenase [NAD] subunit 1, mitochondrial [Exaiptasia diaphana]|nr:Isocitrate dehydrogenase [NAD] subunit 1, mitochondrial [Exaiptasia diaphana]